MRELRQQEIELAMESQYQKLNEKMQETSDLNGKIRELGESMQQSMHATV